MQPSVLTQKNLKRLDIHNIKLSICL